MVSNITVEEFSNLILPIIGMKVSLAWKGIGSAVFLELGALKLSDLGEKYHQKGEACIYLDFNWRLEKDKSIICGSSDSRPYINEQIKLLEDSFIETIELKGDIPELLIRYSNGMRNQTMQLMSGEPGWSVRLGNGDYLFFENGSLVLSVNDGIRDEQSVDYQKEFDNTEIIANRWSIPEPADKSGDCMDCVHFIYLDGDAYLLDFGVCSNAVSEFDGKAVCRTFGCSLFSKK